MCVIMNKLTTFIIIVLSLLLVVGIAYFVVADSLSSISINPDTYIHDAVTEIDDPSSLGIYKLNPSFRVSLHYDVKDYEFLKSKIRDVVSSCSQAQDVEKCVSSKISSFDGDGWVWSLGCDVANEKVFNDFAEFVTGCAQSLDEDACVCNMKNYDSDSIKNDLLKGEYELLISQHTTPGVFSAVYNYTLIKMNNSEHTIKNVSLDYLTGGVFKSFDSVKYGVKYGDDKRLENKLVFHQDLSGENHEWNDIGKIVLLKNGSRLSLVYDAGLNHIAAPNCKPLKKFYRVCAINSKYQFITFNKKTNKVSNESVKYKFALNLEDLVSPPHVFGIIASDTKDTENNITIVWDASSAEDTKEYRIYMNESSFTDATNATLVAVVPHKVGVDKYNITLTVLKDDINYFFGVTAVDFNRNENKTVVPINGISLDDLAPGPVQNFKIFKVEGAVDKLKLVWTRPTNNTDGSSVLESDADLSYTIFKREGYSIQKLNLVARASGVKDNFYTDSGLDPAKTYYFIVIAVDEAGNPSQNFLSSLDLLSHPQGFVQMSSFFAVSE